MTFLNLSINQLFFIIFFIVIIFSIYIKIFKNLSAKYYEENKERLQKKALERYQNLSKEEKNKKRQYGRERYKNLSEEEKQKLAEYKKIYRMRKVSYYNLENFASL